MMIRAFEKWWERKGSPDVRLYHRRIGISVYSLEFFSMAAYEAGWKDAQRAATAKKRKAKQ